MCSLTSFSHAGGQKVCNTLSKILSFEVLKAIVATARNDEDLTSVSSNFDTCRAVTFLFKWFID